MLVALINGENFSEVQSHAGIYAAQQSLGAARVLRGNIAVLY
jgi:hypothetical protein